MTLDKEIRKIFEEFKKKHRYGSDWIEVYEKDWEDELENPILKLVKDK